MQYFRTWSLKSLLKVSDKCICECISESLALTACDGGYFAKSNFYRIRRGPREEERKKNWLKNIFFSTNTDDGRRLWARELSEWEIIDWKTSSFIFLRVQLTEQHRISHFFLFYFFGDIYTQYLYIHHRLHALCTVLATRRKDVMCAWGLGELCTRMECVEKKRSEKKNSQWILLRCLTRRSGLTSFSRRGDESWAKEEKFLMIGKIRIHTLDEIRRDCTQFSAFASSTWLDSLVRELS